MHCSKGGLLRCLSHEAPCTAWLLARSPCLAQTVLKQSREHISRAGAHPWLQARPSRFGVSAGSQGPTCSGYEDDSAAQDDTQMLRMLLQRCFTRVLISFRAGARALSQRPDSAGGLSLGGAQPAGWGACMPGPAPDNGDYEDELDDREVSAEVAAHLRSVRGSLGAAMRAALAAPPARPDRSMRVRGRAVCRAQLRRGSMPQHGAKAHVLTVLAACFVLGQAHKIAIS